jgi:hypothetical protein
MKKLGGLLMIMLLLIAASPAPPLQDTLYGSQGVCAKEIGINGNYDGTGLSYYDKPALHVLYPQDRREAEFVGTTVIQTGQTLHLQSAWKARGANMDSVAHSFVWKLNGVTYSTNSDLVVNNLGSGDYTLELTHLDALNRSYAYSGRVQVLEQTTYAQLVASVAAANQVLFSTGSADNVLYLPIVLR